MTQGSHRLENGCLQFLFQRGHWCVPPTLNICHIEPMLNAREPFRGSVTQSDGFVGPR